MLLLLVGGGLFQANLGRPRMSMESFAPRQLGGDWPKYLGAGFGNFDQT